MRLESLRRALVRPTTHAAMLALRHGDLPAEKEAEIYRITPELYDTYFHVFNDLERTCRRMDAAVGGGLHVAPHDVHVTQEGIRDRETGDVMDLRGHPEGLGR